MAGEGRIWNPDILASRRVPHLVQKEGKGDRNRVPEPLPPSRSPCHATQTAAPPWSHMGSHTRPLTQAAWLIVLTRDAA